MGSSLPNLNQIHGWSGRDNNMEATYRTTSSRLIIYRGTRLKGTA